MREIGEIELAIQGGMEKIESLGEQGKVEESMQEMAAVEALKAEKSEKERELQTLTETSGASGHQKLRVCDVCGAYLSVLDSDRRLADHFGGKVREAIFCHYVWLTGYLFRCISAITNCASSSTSLRRTVRRAGMHLCLSPVQPHPLALQALCLRLRHLLVRQAIALATVTVTGNGSGRTEMTVTAIGRIVTTATETATEIAIGIAMTETGTRAGMIRELLT